MTRVEAAPHHAKHRSMTPPEAATRGRAWRAWWDNRRTRADVLAVGLYVLMAVYVMGQLWTHVNSDLLAGNPNDQTQFEYFIEYLNRVVFHGEFPFFTDRMNVPDGVNLMANTPTYGLTVPLLPITALFGHSVTFAVMCTLGLASTATTWYWLFSRQIVDSRFAAFVGGLFSGFAPGMISQVNGHPNLATQALVPLLIYFGLRLREPHRWLRTAVVLALLVTWQAFINEEVLLFTAIGAGIFVAVWSWHHRAEARAAVKPFARGLALAAGISGALLAYPLYWQFTGPQVYHGLWLGSGDFGTDLGAVPAFAAESLLGNWWDANALATGPSEQNTFYGWPLVVFIAVLIVVFWRHIIARSAMIAAGVLCVLSLGAQLRIRGKATDIPGPYYLFQHLPIFDTVITSRLALFAVPVVGLLMALWVQRAMGAVSGSFREVLPSRLLTLGVLFIALIGSAPTPLAVSPRIPTPTFVTSGAWREYVPEDRTVMTVPITGHVRAMAGMQWSADVQLEMRLVGGYFLAPDPKADGRSMFGLVPTATSELLDRVAHSDYQPVITDAMRADAVNDLRRWRVAIILLDPRTQLRPDALRTVTTELVGVKPVFTGDVWLWDVRSLVDGG